MLRTLLLYPISLRKKLLEDQQRRYPVGTLQVRKPLITLKKADEKKTAEKKKQETYDKAKKEAVTKVKKEERQSRKATKVVTRLFKPATKPKPKRVKRVR